MHIVCFKFIDDEGGLINQRSILILVNYFAGAILIFWVGIEARLLQRTCFTFFWRAWNVFVLVIYDNGHLLLLNIFILLF